MRERVIIMDVLADEGWWAGALSRLCKWKNMNSVHILYSVTKSIIWNVRKKIHFMHIAQQCMWVIVYFAILTYVNRYICLNGRICQKRLFCLWLVCKQCYSVTVRKPSKSSNQEFFIRVGNRTQICS